MVSGIIGSLYLVYSEYGGPEEGGWYYNRYEYVAPEEDIAKHLNPQEIQELREFGEVDVYIGRRTASYQILGESYPKALDGTDNYQPWC